MEYIQFLNHFSKKLMCSGVNWVSIFAWTESVFWCGSVVSSRALKKGMCSGCPPPLSMDRVRIFEWTESAFRCGSVVSSRALKTGMCSGVDRVRIFACTKSAFWCGSVFRGCVLDGPPIYQYLTIKGCKISAQFFLLCSNFARIRGLYNKDQEVIQ